MQILEEKEQMIKEFANQSPCVCFNLRKAARAITQVYDDMFRQIGLTASQISIINALRLIGSMTVLQLAEAVATDRTTITRNLKPLERDGYIVINPGEDKREREISITPKGKAACEKVFSIFGEFQTKLYDKVGKDRVENLCKDLAATVDQIQKI